MFRQTTLIPAAVAAAVALAVGTAEAQESEREIVSGETRDDIRADVRGDIRDDDRDVFRDDRRDGAEFDDPDRALPRQDLIESADLALAQLFREDPAAAEVYEQSYGHAVFDATKGGLLVTGVGGTGVARPNDGNEVVFMRLGGGGVGLGAGFQNYQLVLLFADEEAYANFITGQWDGALSAQAAAGQGGVSAEEPFLGGIRAYRLTGGGLMAQVDALGVRFWPYRRLNEAAQVEARVAAAARSGSPTPVESAVEAEREIMIARADTEAEVEAALADAERQRAEMAAAAETPPRDADSATTAVTQEALTGTPHPERIDEIAAERNDLGLFAEAIKAAGLDDAITGDTAYTVFAPTDSAFENTSGMTAEELLAPENRQRLIELLRAHIVADDLDRDMAARITAARTLDGGTVDLAVDQDRFTVGRANVVAEDLTRGNLRVHVVDGVLGDTGRVQLATVDDDAALAEDGDVRAPDSDARDIDARDIDARDIEARGGERDGDREFDVNVTNDGNRSGFDGEFDVNTDADDEDGANVTVITDSEPRSIEAPDGAQPD